MSWQEDLDRILGTKSWELVEKHYPGPGKYGTVRLTLVIKSVGPLAGGSLVELPGCCGVVVSTGAWVHREYNNRGIGTAMNEMRQERARELGYTVMICTDVVTNVPQQRILDRNGWQKLFQFNNRRTRHDVAMHMVEL